MLQLEQKNITEIAKMLQKGVVLAIPTETVWGFTAGLNSDAALEKLIKIKDRSVNSGKVFTLVPETVESIKNFAKLTKEAEALIHLYFPGPLTLILPKNPQFHHPYYDHFEAIGLRIPDTPLFKELLQKSGPLVLTSANRRGEEPASTAGLNSDNFPELDGIIRGESGGEPPSTVVDLTGKSPRVIRQGALEVL